MPDEPKPILNADSSDGTKPPSKDMVSKFMALASAEKAAFFHQNPSLGFIFNSIHFPKPADTATADAPKQS